MSLVLQLLAYLVFSGTQNASTVLRLLSSVACSAFVIAAALCKETGVMAAGVCVAQELVDSDVVTAVAKRLIGAAAAQRPKKHVHAKGRAAAAHHQYSTAEVCSRRGRSRFASRACATITLSFSVPRKGVTVITMHACMFVCLFCLFCVCVCLCVCVCVCVFVCVCLSFPVVCTSSCSHFHCAWSNHRILDLPPFGQILKLF